MAWRVYWRWYLVAGLALVAALVWFAVWQESPSGELTVAFLNIGQGDAIFVEAPNGNQLLIDGGPDRKVLEELARVMPFYDRSIDVVAATHYDADHVSGLVDVLERYAVSGFLATDAAAQTAVAGRLQTLVAERGINKLLAQRGGRLILDEGVVLQILFPDRSVKNMESNEGSVVAKLTFGEIDFLLTGDAPAKIERYLLALEGKNLAAELLKVGHHGSRTSTAREFVAAVNAEEAVISAGANNRYGHPHAEVLQNLAAAGATVRQTSEGTIVYQTNGRELRRK
jgi:competence protein ComEC